MNHAETRLPLLDQTPVSHQVEVAADQEPDWLALPARPGVIALEDGQRRSLLLATTSDVRAWARRRLAPSTEDDRRSALRPDHRAVTRRLEAIEVGSSLEAEVIYLAQARARMPLVHRVVSERWRPWFVHVDPSAEFPLWSKTRLGAPGESLPPASGVLLGPLENKEVAAKLIDRVTDAFDLCRDYRLLMQAPNARACAYKEMGRCPAPCDGSEPMPSFRARTGRAVEMLLRGLDAARAAVEADMKAAAAATDFELAAMLKQQLDRLEALSTPALAHLYDLRRWRMAAVMPTARAGVGRVLVLAGGRLAIAGEATADMDRAEAGRLATCVLNAAVTAWPDELPEPAQLDTLAPVTRWLHAPKSRRRGVMIRLDDLRDPGEVAARLCDAAAGLRRVREATVPDQAIEA